MPVAIKLIYKRKAEARVCPTPIKDVPNEILVMQKLRHKGIVRYIEWFEDMDSFYLVTERVASNWTESIYSNNDEIDPDEECMTVKTNRGIVRLAVRGGASDLFSFIDLNITVPSSQRREIFTSIARGLAYMHHQHSTTHGDIKGKHCNSPTRCRGKHSIVYKLYS